MTARTRLPGGAAETRGRATRTALLDAAEQLFAERGYAGASLRAITEAAAANLGAVNYHFGSKEGLLWAVISRRVGPVNRERLRLLAECRRAADGGPPDVEAVLRAFVTPVFALRAGGGVNSFVRLAGRMYSEPLPQLPKLHARLFGEVTGLFLDALSEALPGLSRKELWWQLQLVIGTFLHPLLAGPRLAEFTERMCLLDDMDAVADRMIRFAAGGLRAAQAREGAGRARGDGVRKR